MHNCRDHMLISFSSMEERERERELNKTGIKNKPSQLLKLIY
jgi:hypothetical protein